MTEDEVRVFIDGVLRYFDRVTGEPASVETPFLRGEDPVTLDFTGVIGISGRQRGAVLFTSDAELLTKVLESAGEIDVDHAAMADLVGEVANTISGNARRYYGHEFRISVPTVVRGRASDDLGLAGKPKELVIPVVWKGLRSYLVVSLDTPAVFVG